MARLIALGYDDTATAVEAMEEVEGLRSELDIDPEDVAAIIRSEDGRLRTITNQHTVGPVSGEFWGRLFEVLFFVPFLGMAVDAGMREAMDTIARSGMDLQFQDQVRDMLKPGTSALFMVVDNVSQAEAIDALSRFEGSVLKTSLSGDVAKLHDGLRGSAVDRLRHRTALAGPET